MNNILCLIGRITRDLELRYTTNKLNLNQNE